jgi:hypothetical protein
MEWVWVAAKIYPTESKANPYYNPCQISTAAQSICFDFAVELALQQNSAQLTIMEG